MSEFIITSDQMKMLVESVGYFVDEPISEVVIGGETLPDADELRSENAKLLRMLRALALCADDNADCDKCVMNGAVYSSVRQTFCNGMADELRAVGIEVDEWATQQP